MRKIVMWNFGHEETFDTLKPGIQISCACFESGTLNHLDMFLWEKWSK